MPMSHKDLWVKIKRETKGKTPSEEIAVLRGYLADWPRYKGPYQELKKKLSRRVKELERVLVVRGTHEIHADPFSVRKRGLAVVGLVGLPNVGKTTLFSTLTGVKAAAADYPYTTLTPNVGMMSIGSYEFEMVDLPPVSEEPLSELSYASGLKEAVANAELLTVVVDLLGDTELQLWLLGERFRELDIRAVWEVGGTAGLGAGRERPAVLVGSRADVADAGSPAALRSFAPGAGVFGHPLSEDGRRSVGKALCLLVGHIVVQARNPADPDEPVEYAVPVGATAHDLAAAVHRDLAARANGARIWGPSALYDGQEVGLDHALTAGDTVEILEP